MDTQRSAFADGDRSISDWIRRMFATYGAALLGALVFAWLLKALLSASLYTGAGLSKLPTLSIIADWMMRVDTSAQFVKQNPKIMPFMVLFFAPIFEEGCRTFVLTFCKRFNRDEVRGVVIFLSGVVFGIAHGSPFNVFVQGVVGLLIGWMFVSMYLKSGYGQMTSYFACIGVHFMYNLTVVIIR